MSVLKRIFKSKKTDSKKDAQKLPKSDLGKEKKEKVVKRAVKKSDQKSKKKYTTLRRKGESAPISKASSKEKLTEKGKKKAVAKNAYRVLIRPVVTEKTTELVNESKYVFDVSPNVNKIQVKESVEDVYDVTVEAVNMINMFGKHVRYGRIQGKKKGWKKAIVTLKKGDKIEIYEGV